MAEFIHMVSTALIPTGFWKQLHWCSSRHGTKNAYLFNKWVDPSRGLTLLIQNNPALPVTTQPRDLFFHDPLVTKQMRESLKNPQVCTNLNV